MKNKKTQLIVALDVDTLPEALAIVERLSKNVEIFKVGSQLFTACGPEVIRQIQSKNKKVFLDLKFHDIPNTVANTLSVAAKLGVFMCTVHTSGGEEMLKKAVASSRQAVQNTTVAPPHIVGVTVLTSDPQGNQTTDLVMERARLAKKAGLSGVVASVSEAAMIRKELGDSFLIVTPGIRLSTDSVDDQKRVATPLEAKKSGSDFIVVGRPILKASDPAKSALAIVQSLE